jgi:hypothetical protein
MSGLEGGDGFCFAGLTDKLLSMSDLAERIVAATAKPEKRDQYKQAGGLKPVYIRN